LLEEIGISFEINRAGYAVIETIPSEVAVSIAAGLNL